MKREPYGCLQLQSPTLLTYLLQPKTKTFVRKLERILIKLYRQNVSLLLNQTCLDEVLLPNYASTHTNTLTHTRTYIHIYIYIYIYMSVCVCVCGPPLIITSINWLQDFEMPAANQQYCLWRLSF